MSYSKSPKDVHKMPKLLEMYKVRKSGSKYKYKHEDILLGLVYKWFSNQSLSKIDLEQFLPLKNWLGHICIFFIQSATYKELLKYISLPMYKVKFIGTFQMSIWLCENNHPNTS